MLVASLAAVAAAEKFMPNVTSVTCGEKKWDEDQVRSAVIDGCTLYESNKTLGSNKYPHEFRNRESLTFSADGPYMEYPITENGYGKARKGKKGSEFFLSLSLSTTHFPPSLGELKLPRTEWSPLPPFFFSFVLLAKMWARIP